MDLSKVMATPKFENRGSNMENNSTSSTPVAEISSSGRPNLGFDVSTVSSSLGTGVRVGLAAAVVVGILFCTLEGGKLAKDRLFARAGR